MEPNIFGTGIGPNNFFGPSISSSKYQLVPVMLRKYFLAYLLTYILTYIRTIGALSAPLEFEDISGPTK